MGKPAADRGFTDHTVSEPVPPLVITDPTTLHRLPIPVRRWIVDNWLPVGHVTLSYGDGGVGKTLLAQQLMTSCATGTPWCGLAVRRCRVFGIFCEDDAEELHRRQHKINIAADCDFSDLENIRWASAVGADNALVQFIGPGEWRLTPRFHELSTAAKDFHAELLIVDTAADTFGGNENDRQQVRTYLGAVLTKLARDIGCAVLVNAHPSRSGMGQNGDMDGGSTAWSNTARSRWALIRPQGEEGEVDDESLRQLSRRKANYSSIGDTINLRWKDGVLVPVKQGATAFTGMTKRAGVEVKFRDLLAKCEASNINLSNSKHAAMFAPKVFAKRPDRDGYTRQDFEAAMYSLFATNRITMVRYGRTGDARFKIGLVGDTDLGDHGEPLTERDTEVEGWRASCEAMGVELPASAAE